MADFHDLLRENGIDLAPGDHKKARDGWIQFDCPFCGRGSNKFHMGFNTVEKYTNCWKCGYRPLVEVVRELLQCEAKEAKQALYRYLGKVDRSTSTKKESRSGRYTRPPGVISTFLPAHRDYLRMRGFRPHQIAKLWQVECIGIARRYAWTLFIPFIIRGVPVSWTTRKITDGARLRYDTAPPEQEQTHHKTILYGSDYCRHTIIVHEGITDVWKTGPGAAAICGMDISRPQINKIASYPRRVICFDAEHAAQSRASKLCDELEIFDGETYRVELNAKDAGSASPKEIKRLRKQFL